MNLVNFLHIVLILTIVSGTLLIIWAKREQRKK